MLLSHNFDISPDQLPPLSRAEFAAVYRYGLELHPTIQSKPLNHPHWLVEILYASADHTPEAVGEICAQVLVAHRQAQKNDFTGSVKVLVLGGFKTTPPTSTSPEALQPGNWGVDVVETASSETFLTAIAWDKTIAQRPANSVFKIELTL